MSFGCRHGAVSVFGYDSEFAARWSGVRRSGPYGDAFGHYAFESRKIKRKVFAFGLLVGANAIPGLVFSYWQELVCFVFKPALFFRRQGYVSKPYECISDLQFEFDKI